MMSRHTLKPIKPEHHDYEIVTGWDGTLRSFFGEVRRPPVADAVFGGEVVLSIVPLGERNDRGFKEVITAISEFATVDQDLRAALWSDSEKA
jgi:hypothetical protein